MDINRIFPVIQLVLGGIATLLVVASYVTLNDPLKNALTELDNIAGKAESEIELVEELLEDVDVIAKGVQQTIPSHRKSISAVSESIKSVAKTIDVWEEEIPRFQDMSTDTAHIFDTFSSQLPIPIPSVKYEMKTMKFQLPEVIPKTKKVNIPYPTASVKTKTRKINYPKSVTADMKGWSKNFGKIAGKSLGSVSFNYPSGISVSNGSVKLKYPSDISISTKKFSVNIPDNPIFKMKNYSFDVPDKLTYTQRELMKDEKVLLEKSSAQLISLKSTFEQTRESMKVVSSLLRTEAKASLNDTDGNLKEVEKAILEFRKKRIPSVLKDLQAQRESINKSRGVFTAISGLIPLVFGIIGLITAAITVSGAGKLFVKRKLITS